MKMMSKSVLIDGNEAIRKQTGLPYPKNHSRAARERIYPLESEEQHCLFDWSKWHSKKYPDLAWLIHMPSGGYRHKKTARELKATGVKAGFPDILLPVSRHGYHSLAIELKRQRGAKSSVSPQQKAWIEYLKSQGWFATVCYGAGEAIEILEWYIGGEVIKCH